MRFQMASCHSRVAIGFCVACKPLVLPLARAGNALADRGRVFFGAFARHVAVFDCRHFDMQINSIEEGTRDSLPVTLHLDRTAAALAFEIAEISTWARIH